MTCSPYLALPLRSLPDAREQVYRSNLLKFAEKRRLADQARDVGDTGKAARFDREADDAKARALNAWNLRGWR